jgi:vaccinia related kinase
LLSGFSVDEWKKRRRFKHVGLSPYIGSGSHVYRGEKYRFLVLERFGQDLGKLFLQNGKMFPVKTVFYLGIQIVSKYNLSNFVMMYNCNQLSYK